MMHMCDCEFCESCGAETGDTLLHVRVPIKRRRRERAVIEAARKLTSIKLRLDVRDLNETEFWNAYRELASNLRALDALEE